MHTAPLTLLYCPFPSRDTALAAANALLQARLVACCNLLPAGESLYWWNGAITQAAETILLCKTLPAHAAAAMQHLAILHPYECPAILRFSAEAPPPFAAWIAAETSDATKG